MTARNLKTPHAIQDDRGVVERDAEDMRTRLVQIKAQTLIADEGNWRDVIEVIGNIADGRYG